MGFLNVYLKMNNVVGLVWRFGGDDVGNTWNKAQLTITQKFITDDFTIIIEGITIRFLMIFIFVLLSNINFI